MTNKVVSEDYSPVQKGSIQLNCEEAKFNLEFYMLLLTVGRQDEAVEAYNKGMKNLYEVIEKLNDERLAVHSNNDCKETIEEEK